MTVSFAAELMEPWSETGPLSSVFEKVSYGDIRRGARIWETSNPVSEETGFDTLEMVPGRLSFRQRVLRAIGRGDPERALDLIRMYKNKMGAEKALDIAAEARDRLAYNGEWKFFTRELERVMEGLLESDVLAPVPDYKPVLAPGLAI